MNDDRQDRRIRKTRSALRRCLSALLLKKPVKDISVRELTELADINRGTFYLHYLDVFDLLQNLEEEMFLKYTALLDRHDAEEVKESPRKLLVDLLCFIQENADLIRILIGSNGDPNFLQRLRSVFQEKILVPWWQSIAGKSEQEYEYFYSYITEGTIGLIHRWVENGTDLSPEEMATLAERFIVFGSSTLLPPGWTLNDRD